MLLPGTFLGVWNLLQISGSESAGSVSPAWLQAHGHAQVFGWVGSFILGIGFHSVPKRRGAMKPPIMTAWLCWELWTVGVAMRWAANTYPWDWRILLPLSSVLELGAFLLFANTVSRRRPEDGGKDRLDPWIWVVISAACGFLLALVGNLIACFYVVCRGLALHGLTFSISATWPCSRGDFSCRSFGDLALVGCACFSASNRFASRFSFPPFSPISWESLLHSRECTSQEQSCFLPVRSLLLPGCGCLNPQFAKRRLAAFIPVFRTSSASHMDGCSLVQY